MKKGKRLLILLAIAVVFGVGAYLLALNTKQQEAAKEAAKEATQTVLLTTDADKTAKLAYTRGDETVALVKKDNAWVYEPRESFALDTKKVTDMLGNLTQVQAVRTVADTDTDKAEYGLATPAVTVTVTDTAGTAQTIALGDKNATTGNYYVAVEGKPGIYTVSEDLYNAFDISLMQLLTDEAFPTVDTNAVTGLDFDDGQAGHSLEYHQGGDASAYSSAFQWFEKQADAKLAPVNAGTVEPYLSAATGIAYTGTASDTKDDLATYGLDQPRLAVTLHYTEDVPQSQAAAAIVAEAASATTLPVVAFTATPAPTATAAASQSPTAASIATVTPRAVAATATAAATATPAVTAKATATATPAVTAKATATATSAATATAMPTATATATVTATPAKTAGSSLSSAIAEDQDAVPSAEPTATPTATPEPTVPVERTLTLWFGKADGNGNVYMTHSKTNRVFTVSADTFNTLAVLTADGLKVDAPAYLSLADITGMTVTMGGVTKTVTSATETQAAQNGEQTVQTVYQVDGQPLKTVLVSQLVSNLKAIKAESYTDTPVASDAKPVFTATVNQNRAGFETLSIAFYAYDANFDQALVNGDATMLVNKQDVNRLQSYVDGLTATQATATPQTTAAPANP